MNIIAETEKIFGENFTEIQQWTADSGHDDFWCPLQDDEEKVKQLCKLLSKNKEEAHKIDCAYIKTFLYMIENRPEDFFAGHEVLNKIFK